MSKQFIIRILIDILIFVAVLHAWWFIALPLALIGVWKFTYFVEFIIAGSMYDSLFGSVPEMGVLGYVGTIFSIVAFGVVMMLRKVVRR